MNEYTGATQAAGVPGHAVLGEELTDEAMVKAKRRYEVQQAAILLAQAIKIRADAAMMAEIRQYVRDERDQIGALLDDLG